jgi:hypothetical protein
MLCTLITSSRQHVIAAMHDRRMRRVGGDLCSTETGHAIAHQIVRRVHYFFYTSAWVIDVCITGSLRRWLARLRGSPVHVGPCERQIRAGGPNNGIVRSSCLSLLPPEVCLPAPAVAQYRHVTVDDRRVQRPLQLSQLTTARQLSRWAMQSYTCCQRGLAYALMPSLAPDVCAMVHMTGPWPCRNRRVAPRHGYRARPGVRGA